ncbi:hypothetical protein PS15p_211525 [Mucor circinelloides]
MDIKTHSKQKPPVKPFDFAPDATVAHAQLESQGQWLSYFRGIPYKYHTQQTFVNIFNVSFILNVAGKVS